MRQPKTLEERGKIPWSFYVSLILVLLLQYYCGLFSFSTVVCIGESLTSSCASLSEASSKWIKNLQLFFMHGWKRNFRSLADIFSAITCWVLAILVLYILVVAPFKNGMWTGSKAKRHAIHRFGGLCFLVLYGLTWVEYFSNYGINDCGQTLLPHLVGVNGMLRIERHKIFSLC